MTAELDRPGPHRVLFENLDDFWMDDIRRMFSPEAAYGVHWRLRDHHWPEWRVSYVQDTGDVYAQQQGSPNRVLLLGNVPADAIPPDDYLGTFTYYRTLDRILDSCYESAVTLNDLAWVHARLAVAGYAAAAIPANLLPPYT
jgi:hypothetical protein